MDIYPIQIPKALLDKAPENERIFHLMAGQLANDLNILTKLICIALNPVSGHEILNRANTAMAMLMIKMTAGKTHEGWLFISKQFPPLYNKYETDISETAKQNLTELKKYFGQSNLVHTIRNKASFHADIETIKKGYAFFPDDDVFVDFLSEHRGHCLYYSSEIIGVIGMTQLVDNSDWKTGIDKIAREITGTAYLMTDFLLDYMRVFIERYIASSVANIHDNKITIEDAPPIDSVTIPFFCAPPKEMAYKQP